MMPHASVISVEAVRLIAGYIEESAYFTYLASVCPPGYVAHVEKGKLLYSEMCVSSSVLMIQFC